MTRVKQTLKACPHSRIESIDHLCTKSARIAKETASGRRAYERSMGIPASAKKIQKRSTARPRAPAPAPAPAPAAAPEPALAGFPGGIRINGGVPNLRDGDKGPEGLCQIRSLRRAFEMSRNGATNLVPWVGNLNRKMKEMEDAQPNGLLLGTPNCSWDWRLHICLK